MRCGQDGVLGRNQLRQTCGLKFKMKFPVTHFKCMVIMLGPDANYAIVVIRSCLVQMKCLFCLHGLGVYLQNSRTIVIYIFKYCHWSVYICLAKYKIQY
jgi:hypothetical protein